MRIDASLPVPPTDDEQYWYMGRQQRWLLWFQAASFCLVAYSVLRFSTAADLQLVLFLVPTSLYAITLVVSLTSSTRRKRTSRADHDARVAAYAADAPPSVDVFLPSAGEPMEVLANTFHHVSRLRWDGALTVLVLDDSAREEVAALASSYGFTYLSRPDRGRLKKAGNLRYGYDRSHGDLIAVFDADFVPRPDYLDHLVPYAEEPDVGIVQSPQFFDTRADGMRWLERCAGATQELFYRWIQPGRDASRAAICVGTCALYKRSALERSGGFAQIGHSEDVHTGVNLMKVGYHVRYVPIIGSRGICPDSMMGFLNQQYRWCTGSMSLLADPSFHQAEHLSLRQRLCFWSGFLYYISTAANAFLATGPALVMLYLTPRWIEPENSVWLIGAVLLWLVVLPLVFRSRWRVDVLRVQLLYSFAHAVAIVDIVTGRTREWVATGAADRVVTPLGVRIARVAKTWIALTQVALWTGLVWGTVVFGVEAFWAMLALNVVASYVQWPILAEPARPKARPAPGDEPEPTVIDLRDLLPVRSTPDVAEVDA